MSEKINFRVKDETYLRLSALAAEKGLSVGLYVKHLIETQDEHLVNDLKLVQSDTKDIIQMLLNQSKQTKTATNETHLVLEKEPILLEILLLLREIAQPTKG